MSLSPSAVGTRFLLGLLMPGLAVLSPSKARRIGLRPPKHAGIYVVAHRGAHRGIPENSLPAYRKAIELGVDFVEIDVRTTKDGRFVSIHNPTINAYVKGASGRVKDLTFRQLRAFDIGARLGPKWKGTRVPSFEEILDLCKGRCGIYLDLKDAPVEPLVALIRARKMEHDVLWYAGVNKLVELRRYCPDCIAMPDPGPEKNLPWVLKRFRPHVVASTWRYYSKSFVETCHKAGAIVIVDESSPRCWEDAVAWGSDGIQTDHPEKLIRFLEKWGKRPEVRGEK